MCLSERNTVRARGPPYLLEYKEMTGDLIVAHRLIHSFSVSQSYSSSTHKSHLDLSHFQLTACLGSAVGSYSTRRSKTYANRLVAGSCGDGPHGELNVACIHCGHVPGGCNCVTEDNDSPLNIWTANLNLAPSSTSAIFEQTSTAAASSSSSSPSSSSSSSSHVSTTSFGSQNGPDHDLPRGAVIINPHQRGPLVDGEEVYRWTCCKCWGDNSYTYDAGCSYCGDHWRRSCCTVYKVEK
jgi:hypothetical protein